MVISGRKPRHPYFDGARPIALAHRGFSPDGLENSMRAFGAAVEMGYGYIETDVHATADGVAVAFHDATLDRVTDRRGAIADLPWSEVRQAMIGGIEPVPSFEEVLGTWPDLRVNVDVKAWPAVGPLADAIERTQSHHRVCVASFSDARRRAVVGRLSAPVATSAGTGTAGRFVLPSLAGMSAKARRGIREIDCLQVPRRAGALPMVTRRTVRDAHAAGVEVHVWTINDRAAMERLLAVGVDGIITDRADLLRDLLRASGDWPT